MPIRLGADPLAAIRLGSEAVSKAYLGSSLIFEAAAPGFDVMKLAPSWWLDAADASTLTLVDGGVNQWRDKSGNNKHVMTHTASRQPRYNPAHPQANNKPALHNSAGNQILITHQITGYNNVGEPLFGQYTVPIEEIWIVAGFGFGTETVFTRDTIGWGDGYSALFGGPGSNGQPRMMGLVNSGNFIQSNTFAPGGFKNLNGAYRGSGAAGAPPMLPLPLAVMRFIRTGSAPVDVARYLMAQDQSATRGWNGPVCEVVAFPSLKTDAEYLAGAQHLISKWGIVV